LAPRAGQFARAAGRYTNGLNTRRRGNANPAPPARASQEKAVSRVVAFVPVRVAQLFQEVLEGVGVGRWHLDTHQNTAVVIALVAVVKQADVPLGAHGAQELDQGAGALGK